MLLAAAFAAAHRGAGRDPMTSAEKPRVGVVGVGHLGKHHARLLRGLDCELVAVADPNEAARAYATTTFGVPETAARRTPPCSCRLKSTVAVISLAVTEIVEPPMQQVVPHARTLRRTFGRRTVARRPPAISASDVVGWFHWIEPAL